MTPDEFEARLAELPEQRARYARLVASADEALRELLQRADNDLAPEVRAEIWAQQSGGPS